MIILFCCFSLHSLITIIITNVKYSHHAIMDMPGGGVIGDDDNVLTEDSIHNHNHTLTTLTEEDKHHHHHHHHDYPKIKGVFVYKVRKVEKVVDTIG